ncbi:MAG TPA: hypothetical protein VEA18_03875 [Candidatus Kapabacteria bacterium]|nr:hypothetical protein [Candidatus Kapabacteria bacterium]
MDELRQRPYGIEEEIADHKGGFAVEEILPSLNILKDQMSPEEFKKLLEKYIYDRTTVLKQKTVSMSPFNKKKITDELRDIEDVFRKIYHVEVNQAIHDAIKSL